MSDIIDEELVETNYATIEEETIGEGENAKKQICFRSILSEADTMNGNHRIYPKNVLRTVFNEAKEKSERTGQPIIGEIEHPRDGHVNLERIAVTFPEFTWDEETGQIRGKAVPTLTEAGRTIEGLAKSGMKICFSTRMAGKVKPIPEERKRQLHLAEDCVEVQPGAKLISIDCIFNPSCVKSVADTVYEEKTLTEEKHYPTFKEVFDSLL